MKICSRLTPLQCCLLAAIVVRAAGAQPSRGSASVVIDSITGTYRWKTDGGAGCELQTALQAKDSVRFQVDCTRGPPAYNRGVAVGVIALRNASAIYRTTEFGHVCELRIWFRGKQAMIGQVGSDSDCGFGYGVTAQGTYARVSSRRPTFEGVP